MGVTDCHVHINPFDEMLPAARKTISAHHRDFAQVERFLEDPRLFLAYMDRCGVERSVLVNYVSPEVVGYSEKANDFVARYVRTDPERLIAVGSVHPRRHPDPLRALWELKQQGIRGIKLHPPHQLFAPNEHLAERGANERLAALYRGCQELKLPIIFHTGTSIFPGARNRFAEPMLIEDVAVDHPDLTIVLAHGGRPFWTEQAMFLCRRFSNVYLEVSGVPPEKLLTYFPDLERLSERVLFGSDWPGPGVKDVLDNLSRFEKSGLSDEARERILRKNPETVFPRIHPA
ncbi:MAG: amidohydrolase [Euryarchaeota archaeon]|nr:amidohydrolase [Euryarchaeota archaeon]MDE1835875.1 amidohydrolase [Euryarchaeota archaeon]MDE1881382.1 amidohydrolase [Euryarchaeota archaeon]MDE2044447.1 amidohydrolase [Thermoplasmata archaeon]